MQSLCYTRHRLGIQDNRAKTDTPRAQTASTRLSYLDYRILSTFSCAIVLIDLKHLAPDRCSKDGGAQSY
ncbi:uncharacterized protein PHALS_08393 [Plasmopara halstedii]|uniref:Uncharacterized protein n=1 Tax=Plasmopara halstedii TaxID=4781 RepID=A0A0P1ACW9_PLAHL|nr:uncharacterized protein PHALS_08393 [Plasmopara halstedii]CEG38312.1 hypothetical protein PHALS_08393 [Plasmopara halstedii]|eukprot:XP_024574681.1 hypothetical protein PHALS_08393 [Plasmopara halstedii]